MNEGTDKLSEHDEIEMLLPWYVTGKLEAGDAERVKAYLAEHPEMRDRLELGIAERSETAFLIGPETAPPEAEVDRFMAGLAKQRPTQSPAQNATRFNFGSIADWIRSVFVDPFFGGPQVHWGKLAAALIILLQTVTIIALIRSEQSDEYHKAQGGSAVTLAGTYAIVRFADKAPADRIVETMSELKVEITSGPKADGLFTVRIGPETMSAAERDRMISVMRQRTDVVTFVTPTR